MRTLNSTFIFIFIFLLSAGVSNLVYSQSLLILSEHKGVLDSIDYIAKSDIIVPEGQKLRIQAGARLFFYPGVSLKVNGILECKGTLKKSILFTSIKDTISHNFLQWEGIKISTGGKILFKNCIISSSKYGIDIADSSSIILFDSISFFQNDNSLILNHESILWEDSTFYSIAVKPEISTALSVGTASRESLKLSPGRRTFLPAMKYLFFTCAAVSLGGYIWCKAVEYRSYSELEQQITDDNKRFYKNRQDLYERYSNRWLLAGLISTTGFAATITVDIIHKRSENSKKNYEYDHNR